MVSLFETYCAHGDNDAAIAVFETTFKKAIDTAVGLYRPYMLRLRSGLLVAYAAKHEESAAIDKFELIIRSPRGFGEWGWLGLLRAYVAAGDKEGAIKRIESATTKVSESLEFSILGCYLASGDLHTGLGRASLPAAATEAAVRAAAGYSDLEVERETGARGRRSSRAELLLTAITGAEAALVVNNNAAALMLALAALAKRKEVPVSRGELIEIGGEFRLPDIMAASGAKLVEVGTTNRTRLSDYGNAITDHTGLLLKVHPSNYRVVGFAQQPSVQQLADLAHKHGIPLLHDLGSGLLRHSNGIPAEEPAVDESLAAGTDLACFSGDKLLGGPQAGIIVGRADMIDTLRAHPIARAVRVDKMQIAALESVLSEYAKGTWDQLPVWQMLREPLDSVKHRAQELARKLDGDLEGARVVPAESAVGGGSLPGYGVPSFAVRLETPDPSQFAAHLRTGQPPIFAASRKGPSSSTCAPSILATPSDSPGRFPTLWKAMAAAKTDSVVATAGHVDHGKSSLINRLTGMDVENLGQLLRNHQPLAREIHKVASARL
jgi:L-seryl-tRNA(Ser) seleniumtransferase